MKKKNTKTQNKKLSVAGILGLVLLGLVLVGVVANVIKDNPFKDSSNDNPTVVIERSDCTEEITIEYEEGMTWAEWVESDYNTHHFVLQEDNTITLEVVFEGEPHVMVITLDGNYETVVLGDETIDQGNYKFFEY